MLYHQPTIGSMDKWANRMNDDQGYTFNDLPPYFQKWCHYTPPNPDLYANTNTTNKQVPDAFAASGGPLNVLFSNTMDEFDTWLHSGFIAAGMRQIDGFSSGKLIGSSQVSFTIDSRNAHRSSAESSFLQASLRMQPELTVYKNTLAQKVVFHADRPPNETSFR